MFCSVQELGYEAWQYLDSVSKYRKCTNRKWCTEEESILCILYDTLEQHAGLASSRLFCKV
jgi:hypothetical protein